MSIKRSFFIPSRLDVSMLSYVVEQERKKNKQQQLSARITKLRRERVREVFSGDGQRVQEIDREIEELTQLRNQMSE